MDDWYHIKAADFINFNPRESLPKNKMTKKVAMECLQPFSRDIGGFKSAPFCGGTKFRNGDTIMARITPCLENGKTAQVNTLENDEVGFGSTEFIVMRAKPDISDKDFIYYLATSPFFRNIAIRSMVGSSGRQRVQQGVLDATELFVPPLAEQIEIGRTLKTLDDKIANNSRINHHLPSPISATDSSPDIRRGKRVSRSSAKRAFSLQLLSIVSKIGCILSSNAFISFVAGAGTNSVSKSRVTMASKTAPFALRFNFSTTVSAR